MFKSTSDSLVDGSLELAAKVVTRVYGAYLTELLSLDDNSFSSFLSSVSDRSVAEDLKLVYMAITNTSSKFNADVFMRGPNEQSIIMRTDSYKVGNYRMLKSKGKTLAYLEARSGSKYEKTGFFGLQYYLVLLKRLRVTQNDIDRADRIFSKHLRPGAFNRSGWQYILDFHKGKLPIEVYAPDEGSQIKTGNVMMIVSNTDDECFWLPTYLETFFEHIWYPCTVTTISKECKNIMTEYVDLTCDTRECLSFMLHDFGGRGVNTDEGAEVGGAAHTVNFMGTDTVLSIPFIENYYLSDVCSYSVDATEHAIMTKKGRTGELSVVEELIDSYPTGILSMVSDSYNLYGVLDFLGTTLRDKILSRDGKLAIRPDSGDPLEISLEVLQILDRYFGTTINSKGYKVLNPKIGLIYGDGINPEMIGKILDSFKNNGYAACNIIFGMGGGLLQKCNRDTQRFAYKVCAFKPQDQTEYQGLINDDGWVHIYKDPLSKEGGSKKSKAGPLILVQEDGEYKTINGELDDHRSVLKLRFFNGELTSSVTYSEIRDRMNLSNR